MSNYHTLKKSIFSSFNGVLFLSIFNLFSTVVGKEDMTYEEMEKVCRMANAHNFISDLPQVYCMSSK